MNPPMLLLLLTLMHLCRSIEFPLMRGSINLYWWWAREMRSGSLICSVQPPRRHSRFTVTPPYWLFDCIATDDGWENNFPQFRSVIVLVSTNALEKRLAQDNEQVSFFDETKSPKVGLAQTLLFSTKCINHARIFSDWWVSKQTWVMSNAS